MPHGKSLPDFDRATCANNSPADCARGQLPLKYNDRYQASEANEALYVAATEIVANATLKQAAYDLDQPASSICKALKHQERHYCQLDWLFWLVSRDETKRIAKLVCEWAGGEFAPRVELTDHEWRERVTVALESIPEFAEIIKRKAGVR